MSHQSGRLLVADAVEKVANLVRVCPDVLGGRGLG